MKKISSLFRILREDNIVLKKAVKIAKQVEAKKKDYREMLNEDLAKKTMELRLRLEVGETLDEILVDAFATIREVSRRTVGMFPFFVQIVGGIIIHWGDLAEMKTGEGKTLALAMPLYLNSLSGRGVHVVTANDYLVQRDAEFMAKIMSFVGLTVGSNAARVANQVKRVAYSKDITYTTHSELGFDYLRDNMVQRYEDKVQRGLNFAVVDEVDSSLIDEARTPLIISGGKKDNSRFYTVTDKFVKTLSKEDDFTIDAESKGINLTPDGAKKAEDHFGLENLFAISNSELVHRLQNALRANFVFAIGVEYIIREGKIMLVDQFTGRVMEGRSYSEGLQQAIQAKEGIEIEPETQTIATITYQALFRLYRKLAGTTGTAKTEEEEFKTIYNMRVICVPTNKSIIRLDRPDYIYSSKSSKYRAIVREIHDRHTIGQPILIGTTSVEDSEYLSRLLTEKRIPHNVLNAKNHTREAEIVSYAGRKGQVTLSTNMAGRGTDIKLQEGVIEVGGLYVIGTERHEARRIDNQLRGRSGRQGDPGESRFFISIEDELFRRFGNEKLKTIFADLGEDHIQATMLSRAITTAQKKIEGMNFDTRKNLLDYDDILSGQREIIYKQRDNILLSEDLLDLIKRMQKSVAKDVVDMHLDPADPHIIVTSDLIKAISGKIVKNETITKDKLKGLSPEEAVELIADEVMKEYKQKRDTFEPKIISSLERNILLQVFDKYWMQQIDAMTKLRQGISLRALEQTNPINIYAHEANQLFRKMRQLMAHQICVFLNGLTVQRVERTETKPPTSVVAKPVALRPSPELGTAIIKNESKITKKPAAIKNGNTARNLEKSGSSIKKNVPNLTRKNIKSDKQVVRKVKNSEIADPVKNKKTNDLKKPVKTRKTTSVIKSDLNSKKQTVKKVSSTKKVVQPTVKPKQKSLNKTVKKKNTSKKEIAKTPLKQKNSPKSPVAHKGSKTEFLTGEMRFGHEEKKTTSRNKKE